MKDRKHLDRLFQEKLKDFEATPNDSLWDKISSELHIANKERKGIPAWWRVAGVAAGLLLLFTLSQLINNDQDTVSPLDNNIVDIESENDVLTDENTGNTNIEGDNVIKENNVLENSNPVPSNSVNSSLTNVEKYTDPVNQPNNKDNLNAVSVGAESGTANYDTSTNIDKKVILEDSEKTKLSTTKNDSPKIFEDNSQNNIIKKEKAGEILNQDLKSTQIVETNQTNLDNTNTIEVNKENNESLEINTNDEKEKLSLIEEIAVNEDENIDDEDEDFKRWSAAPNVGPVYFNSLGNGSSIHPEFVSNSKSGDINLSYGISASYAINKKLTVRTGIHKVNLGYSTNNVVVYNNVGSPINTPLLKLSRNIKMTEDVKNLSFINVSEFNFAQVQVALNNLINSSIDQKLGFVEIPLELKYNISSKKLNINLIGGFSTLILSDNEVYVVDNGNSILLGEATNINNTSFSANFGLGFDFKMSDNISLNLEPVFKYQLNTFNNTSGNFKPYFLGVYSGLSFKF
jgi:hypothetical protein